MEHPILRRRAAVGAAVLLLTGGLGVALAIPAEAAPTCGSGVPGDVNGDGFGEAAVSSTAKGQVRGAVHVFYGQSGRVVVNADGSALDDQYFDQDTPGVPGQATGQDLFGSATAFGDFNADGCADLAIGAAGDGRSGSVTVLFGSPRGLTTAGVQRFGPDAYLGYTVGSFFGRSLVAADLDGDGIDDLAVGAPNLTVAGQDLAGGLVVFRGSEDGLRLGADDAAVITQDSPGVPSSAGSVHQFGISLATGDFDGNGRTDLAVGATGDAGLAGAVQILRGGPSGFGGSQPEPITQETPGVPGTNDPLDDFGVALAAGDVDADGRDDLAVGESGSGTANGGGVYLLPGTAGGITGVGAQLWTQASPGVPGASEGADRFGVALAMGRLDAGVTDDLAIGAPNDTAGGTAGAGTVTVLFGGAGGLSVTSARQFHQDVAGLSGAPEGHDEFGSAVGTAVLRSSGQEGLIIGAPGERIGQQVHAGLISQLAVSAGGPVTGGSRTFNPDSPGVKGTLLRQGTGFGDAINGPIRVFD